MHRYSAPRQSFPRIERRTSVELVEAEIVRVFSVSVMYVSLFYCIFALQAYVLGAIVARNAERIDPGFLLHCSCFLHARTDTPYVPSVAHDY